jgi:hypothetical protein
LKRKISIEHILKDEESIGGDEDLPHIIHIHNFVRCRRALKRPTSKRVAKS